MLTRDRVSPLAAEFFGTAIWAYVALVLSETTAVSYFIATSVAVALGVAYMLFSSVSGGHFNPAITFGMWTARRITSLRGAGYIVAQLLGGLAAWKLYEYFTNHSLAAKNVHYSTATLLAELVGTAILAMGLCAAVARAYTALESALTIGASLFVGVLVAATASTGILNPAVALGLRSFNAAYILGPLLGGLIGVTLYNWLFVGTVPRVVRRVKK
ncbi:MAG: major intrinsic protein [Candidatus Saccharibacteria bacterium]|nr:major intrinsic protein [Candidatus Saccharibacteria bacterium]